MRKILVVVMAAGLALAAAARVGPADPVSPQERCAAAERDSATLADIRANLRTAPAVAMMQLGISIDEFEPMARALYDRWRVAHPQPPVQSPAPVIVPLAAPAPPEPDHYDQVAWWCFRTAGDASGDCSSTKAGCEQWRARLALDHFRTPCAGLSEQQCADIAAGVQGITVCEWQSRASCFTKHFKLDGHDELACAPTIKLCKTRRADVAKNYTDDQAVKSDCAAHE